MARPNALKFYDGPSEIDGSPIIGVISGLVRASRNTKTGDLFQSWIMPRDVPPHVAVTTGDDVGVCDRCILRPLFHKATPVELRPCYVKAWRGPRSVWESMHDAPVATVSELAKGPNRVTGIRFGGWGDPTAIPLWIWLAMLGVLRESIDPKRSPGYTHRWDVCDPRWSRFLMASVHNEGERARAKAMGWRTFRIVDDRSEIGDREILCPNTTHGVQCVDCALCDGVKGPANAPADYAQLYLDDRRADIAIEIHR